MTDLVPVHHPVPVDEEEVKFGSEDDALKGRLEEIVKERERVEARLASIGKRLNFMQSVLVDETRDLSAERRSLTEEIEALQAEIRDDVVKEAESNRAAWQPDDLDAEFEQYDRERNDEFEDPVFFYKPPEDEPESPELVALYRKISMKTHPDRTDDPEKHALFISAKTCREQREH